MKKIIRPIVTLEVIFILKLSRSAKPMTISKQHKKTEINKEKGINISNKEVKSLLNTWKYSSSFIWVPTGSFILMPPEKINNDPTKYLDKVYIIPEVNASFRNEQNIDVNSSLVLRYSYNARKSADLYITNAAGTQDVGQMFENNQYKFGLKLNFLY